MTDETADNVTAPVGGDLVTPAPAGFSPFSAQALLAYYREHAPSLKAALGLPPPPPDGLAPPDRSLADPAARYPDPSTLPKARLDYPDPVPLMTPAQTAGILADFKNRGQPDPVGFNPNPAPPLQAGSNVPPGAPASPKPTTLSDKGVDFIFGFEGAKNYDPKTDTYRVYDDGYGNPTIGHGHLVPSWGAYPDGINSNQAKALFKSDSDKAIAAVQSKTSTALTQNQLDALASLYFNDPAAFKKNAAMASALKAGKLDEAANTFSEYNTVNKTPNRGLSVRRARERDMFLNGVYDSKH